MAKKTAGDKDILVVPNGVDPEIYCPVSRKKDDKKLCIFFAGRLRLQKGLKYLIQSIDEIKRNKSGVRQDPLPDFYLKIAGCGPQESYLKGLVKKKGLEDNITFLGYLDEGVLIKEFQNSDIFVNPSINEGMPASVLEAMACGLPCVVTDIEGHNEIIQKGKNGFLVPAKETKHLIEALVRLMRDKALRKYMGQANRETVLKEFTWKIIAERFIEIIKEVSLRNG